MRDALRNREQVGGDVVIEAGQAARDVSAVGGSVTLRAGAEADDVVAVGGSVTLEQGAKAKDVVAVGGSVKVGPDAVVEGDAVSIGGEVKIDPSGVVEGEHVTVGVGGLAGLLGSVKSIKEKRQESEHGVAWSFFMLLLKYGIFFALALLVVMLVPRRVEVLAATMMNDPLRSIGTGILAVLAQPFVSLGLIVTIVGIPLLLVQVVGLVLGRGDRLHRRGRADRPPPAPLRAAPHPDPPARRGHGGGGAGDPPAGARLVRLDGARAGQLRRRGPDPLRPGAGRRAPPARPDLDAGPVRRRRSAQRARRRGPCGHVALGCAGRLAAAAAPRRRLLRRLLRLRPTPAAARRRHRWSEERPSPAAPGEAWGRRFRRGRRASQGRACGRRTGSLASASTAARRTRPA